jgi:hypothetical protein
MKKITIVSLVLFLGVLIYNVAACENPTCECTCPKTKCSASCEDCKGGGVAAGCCKCCGEDKCCDARGASCGGWPFYSPNDARCNCTSC